MDIRVGSSLTLSFNVDDEDLISAIDSRLPPVLGTYVIVKWAEITSSKLVLPDILDSQLTVGVRVDIKHFGLASIGNIVNIESNVTSVKGNIIGFEINVKTQKETIATLKHSRALITTEQFLKKLDFSKKSS